jgi:hypothetical protein
MNFYNIVHQFMLWGKEVKTDHIINFKNYLSEMLRRNRIIVIEDESGIACILAYFLTDDIEKFANRPMWSCPEDSDTGETFFVDKMVARKWNREIRNMVQDQVEKRFPFVSQAYWLREPKNRSVIIRRRGAYELHTKVC